MTPVLKALAVGLTFMAVVGVFSPRKTMLLEPTAIPGSGVSHNAHATARLLQQLTQAPVAIAAPATEISTAAPAVEVGVTVPGPSGEPVSASTALFTAIANSDVATIERLFAAGASTDVYSPQGTTPLTEAIVRGDPTVINAILTKGVDTNLPTRPQGVTPLSLAIQQGNLALAQRLLDAGADINLRDAAGDTVLLQTVKRSPVNYVAVELLLSRRPSPTTSAPDLTATDAQGRNPRQIALASGDQRLIGLFQTFAPSVEPSVERPSSSAAAVAATQPTATTQPSGATTASPGAAAGTPTP